MLGTDHSMRTHSFLPCRAACLALTAALCLRAQLPRERSRVNPRGAHEFFEDLGRRAQPVWTKDIARRGAVFSNPPAGCYRTQVSYNPALKR